MSIDIGARLQEDSNSRQKILKLKWCVRKYAEEADKSFYFLRGCNLFSSMHQSCSAILLSSIHPHTLLYQQAQDVIVPPRCSQHAQRHTTDILQTCGQTESCNVKWNRRFFTTVWQNNVFFMTSYHISANSGLPWLRSKVHRTSEKYVFEYFVNYFFIRIGCVICFIFSV